MANATKINHQNEIKRVLSDVRVFLADIIAFEKTSLAKKARNIAGCIYCANEIVLCNYISVDYGKGGAIVWFYLGGKSQDEEECSNMYHIYATHLGGLLLHNDILDRYETPPLIKRDMFDTLNIEQLRNISPKNWIGKIKEAATKIVQG